MKAYSLDFRKKILDTYHNTPISQRQLAQKFNVALSFITKLLKQWRETGNLESKPLPGRPKKLNSDQEQVLLEILAEHNDWTLAEYQQELKALLGVEVSTTTICRLFKARGYSLKKNHASHREILRASSKSQVRLLERN